MAPKSEGAKKKYGCFLFSPINGHKQVKAFLVESVVQCIRSNKDAIKTSFMILVV